MLALTNSGHQQHQLPSKFRPQHRHLCMCVYMCGKNQKPKTPRKQCHTLQGCTKGAKFSYIAPVTQFQFNVNATNPHLHERTNSANDCYVCMNEETFTMAKEEQQQRTKSTNAARLNAIKRKRTCSLGVNNIAYVYFFDFFEFTPHIPISI